MTRPRADSYSIATLPGDGIGKEVMPEAMEIVDLVAQHQGFSVEWAQYPWSCEYYHEHGEMMPANGIDLLREHDAIFLGAVGDPSLPDHISLWGLLIPIRRAFEQYINLRPAQLFPGVQSPLRDTSRGIDILVVRENSEGEYSEVGGRVFAGTPNEMAVQEAIFTRRGTERVIEFAAQLALKRSKRLVSATKSNGIIHSMTFWDEVFKDVMARHTSIEGTLMHVDALAARFVSHPHELDVVVGSNLFGDILSDIGAVIVGSMGMAPSANLNPSGEYPSMFEPVHGSAPDIAGRSVANPIGQMWSAALMFEHLGRPEAHDVILEAIHRFLDNTDIRTPDLGGSASTKDVTQAIKKVISELVAEGS